MKTAYESLAVIQQASEQITEHIEFLKTAGLLRPEPADIRKLAIEQIRAEISLTAVLNLADLEHKNAASSEKQRLEREKKLNT